MNIQMKQHYKDEFEYVRRSTKRHSKSFYFSTQLLPADRRNATYALYGFCRYADNIVDNPRSRSQDELMYELDALRAELETAYRTGESEHPVLGPFIVAANEYDIPKQYPLDLIEGVRMDLLHTRYETFEELELFCYRVASTVGLMMTHVLGYNTNEAFGYAKELGTAMQLTNILRDVKEDKDRGRIYLPLAELDANGIRESDILHERFTPAMDAYMRTKTEEAHQYFEKANTGIAMLKRESRFAIYAASNIYRGILYKIEDAGYNPFPERVYVSGKQKVAIMLREYLMTKFRPEPGRVSPLMPRNAL